MAVSDWFTTQAANITIDGTNIDENCPPGNMNFMGRAIMASVRVMYDNLPSIATLMPKIGGTFSGTQPIFLAEGAFLHHASASNASGKMSLLPTGSARPASPANGDIVFYHAP